MHAILYNQARILYRLKPITGLLIKSGKVSFDPTRPDMEFIRTHAEIDQEITEVPFLPGSSIKGIVRSHAERILRALNLRVCDITLKNNAYIPKENQNPPYRKHCLACRTFGYTTLSSRIRFADAFPWLPDADSTRKKEQLQKVHFEHRPGIQINRRNGTVAHGPFEVETITAGEFYGEITLRNYQLWQVALLAFVIRDINEGHQRIGAMKSRGLGRVRISIDEFRLDQYGVLFQPDDIQIRGIGATKELIEKYGLFVDDVIEKPDRLKVAGDGIMRQSFVPKNADADSAWQEMASAIINSPHWKHLLKDKGTQR